MFKEHTGISTLEWVVLGVIVILVVGGALIAVGETMGNKLKEINVQLGS